MKCKLLPHLNSGAKVPGAERDDHGGRHDPVLAAKAVSAASREKTVRELEDNTMTARQLDRTAYVAAHAILSTTGVRRTHAIDDVAEIIKAIFEPLCDAEPARTTILPQKILHSAAESAARNGS